MTHRRTAAWVFLAVAWAGLPACQRDNNPLLATPSGAITSINGFGTADTDDPPFVTLDLVILDDFGFVANLELANVAILVDGKPEVPISIDKTNAAAGSYKIKFRSRSKIESDIRLLIHYGGVSGEIPIS